MLGQTHYFIFLITVSIFGIILSILLSWHTMRKGTGSKKMQTIAGFIKEGANAFIKRQYTTIGLLSVALAVIIVLLYGFTGNWELGIRTGVAFIMGAILSSISGIVGMLVSVRANIRVAAASRESINDALKIALRAGGVSAMAVVALSMLGVSLLYYAFGGLANPTEVPFLIVGFAFGASFVALFAQLGGGIFTKGADVGADIVGKIEAGIPEDDPRNPAVIADLVGDNVGDCAGRGADLFESNVAEMIGAMIIGVALFPAFGVNGILFPLVIRGFDIIASIIGILTVRTKESGNPMTALSRGYYVTAILAAIAFYFVTKTMLFVDQYPKAHLYYFFAGLIGIVTSIILVWITIYYTDSRHNPVKSIAKASETGHATNIIQGFAVALETTAWPVIVLSIALFFSYMVGVWSGIPGGGIYGTAIATMGMLATCAYILAMDNFGPIADNAGGINEMSGLPAEMRKRTDKLDAAGNTTKALTKGYAIGTAALAAFLLFSAYIDNVIKLDTSHKYVDATGHFAVDLTSVPVFIGALLGAMLIFLFSSFAIKAVGRTAGRVVTEVRRQFKEIKGIMQGKALPDYAKCVDICTTSALKSMVVPGVLVVVFTVVVGLLLKAEAVAAFLMVATISGILMALMFNNGGGAWDNAKKYIEDGKHGGKGSEAHKAAVTGDTVGDPFKDTAGPSLHVLIKLLATLTLVLAPLFL
ncbi:MAG: sodium-translocating pyrophosphatase [Nanoarchaeota archaeon]|nr:sodium-translocating pyrophosphatase [Nanoarchaeota archaeon]